MEEIQKELADLERKGTFSNTIKDVQQMIESLEQARDSITANPDSAALALMKLKTPMKTQWDQVNTDLKKVYSALNSYQKVLNKKFKTVDLSIAEDETVSSETFLVNRAIAMHLLREGQFEVASSFIKEANAAQPHYNLASSKTPPADSDNAEEWEIRSEALQTEFASMYHILHEMRMERNLTPAIDWTRQHSRTLETRGSNLEFELISLQYKALFIGSEAGPINAWSYARSQFYPFQQRYATEIQQLSCALAYRTNLGESPYASIFQLELAWEQAASSFTKEFCSLLGLSADSPLYVAATAGAIALPSLLKVKTVMKNSRTEWTTTQELPVEIPLPPAYHFHSIFVCPVSKEQATDSNPPMMMPCGHVICKESLERVSKGTRFKCPYCPGESHPRDARKVYL